MKVKELIEILTKLDPEKEISHMDNEIGYDLSISQVVNSEEDEGYTII